MRTLIFFVFILSAFNVRSAIVNYDDKIDNSFYDTETELVWIDFGVTNSRQYVKTVDQLNAGGIYEGWRLPILEEVMIMFANLAFAEGQQADINYAETTTGRYDAQDENTVGNDDSIWDPVFDIIGYNDTYAGGLATYSEALFQGSDGLSSLIIADWGNAQSITDSPVNDYLTLLDHRNADFAATSSYEGLSTLLVRESSVSVPEPKVFALLICAFLFLMLRAGRPHYFIDKRL